MIGKTISHYKILEKLGQGGMGVVYKARDTKLDRLLALKFLPPHLSVNAADKERFLQEAKAASAINHPNVCVIHDILEHDAQQFLVMEYVEGKTLREHAGANGPVALPVKDVIDYALQIAAALEAAHNQGIVHRDIKSENIMVSSSNRIKVMDFGLAKLKGSLKLTKTSSTVGTLAYMAPEQIEGRPSDARADIFSFGVVLYEMLAGKLPFNAEYESALMYAIINEDPEPLENMRSDISSELLHVLNRSLEKDPEDRYQNMHEVVIDLNRVKRDSSHVSRKSLKEMPLAEAPEETKEPAKEIKAKGKPAWAVPAVLLSIVLLATIAFFIFNPFSGEPLPPMKTVPFTSLPGAEESPSFSPDGRQIAFSWQSFEKEDPNDYDIYVKPIGPGSKDLLVGGEGTDVLPAWSPDGLYIAFFRRSKNISGIYSMHIIPQRGGTERKLASINLGEDWWWTNLSWSPDSKSIAFAAMDSVKDFYRIYLLSVESNQIQELTNAPDLGLNDKFCAISPDGNKLAVVRGSRRWGDSDIYIVPMNGGKTVRLTSNNTGIGGLAWTSNGSEIVYCSDPNGGEKFGLWRITATGGIPRQVPVSGEDIASPAVANQGNRLACQKWIWDENIMRLEIPKSKSQNHVSSKLIYSTQIERTANYSPDGGKIAYASNRSGSPQIWISNRDGEEQVQLTNTVGNTKASNPCWSPDGHMIAYIGSHKDKSEIFSIPVDGGPASRITKYPAEYHSPSYSKDGSWIYFTSNRSGEWQIWKIPAQGGTAVQVTRKGGYTARESTDSEWLYYTKDDTTGIWKKPLPEGEETLVLDCKLIVKEQWDLAENGIYYIEKTKIKFYDFTTRDITAIADTGGRFCNDLHVSPDQHWILYTEALEESDIVLVENFR